MISNLAQQIGPSSASPSEPIWTPFPASPQQRAYQSAADVLGYGGAAGGGKSDLLLGLAFTQHERSIIFRRNYTDLTYLVERGDDIQDGRCRFVWSPRRAWVTQDRRIVELGAVDQPYDLRKYKGRPHDLIGIDEAVDFPEDMVRFLTGWLRTTTKGQRTRVVLTFNPPTDATGEWIIQFFAPWLDPQHRHPAEPGELRWFARINDRDVEVDGPEPFEHDGEVITPQSRTFIPARVEDNPYLMATDYVTQLNNLPEPLRSQLRHGDFAATVRDNVWQVIPTQWVIAAQARWTEQPPDDMKLRAVGVDVARGGEDKTAIARLCGTWFAPILEYAGEQTPNGAVVARFVHEAAPDDTPIWVDVIGYGASAYDHLDALGANVYPVNNAEATPLRDKSGRYQFANVRAASYWLLREALDPDSGQNIALPPSRALRSELCAVRYKVVGARIALESKQEVIKRTGHSPDLSDAVAMAWYGALVGEQSIRMESAPPALADYRG